MLGKIRLLDDQIVWMQFLTEEAAEEVMEKTACKGDDSAFYFLGRWMECMGFPPRPCWIKIKNMPLHVWHEEVFKLLGECLGHTVEVDKNTAQKEHLKDGRIKVLLDGRTPLPTTLPI